MYDMKPTIEKMTSPANMLVQELIQQTIMESLETKNMIKRNKDGNPEIFGTKPYILFFCTCRHHCCKGCSFPVQ